MANELQSDATRVDPGFSSEATQVGSGALAVDPSAPFLYCEQGVDRGAEFPLIVGETTVGRAVENEVVLKDLSVSRRHLRVVRDPRGTLRLRDLGSGNGSVLNGVRIDDAPLRDGDRISLGETVLVVRIPGAASASMPAPAPAPSSPPRVYLGGALAGAGASVRPAAVATPVHMPSVPVVQSPRAPGPVPVVHAMATAPLSSLDPTAAAQLLGQKSPDEEEKAKKRKSMMMIGGAVAVALLAIGAAALTSKNGGEEQSDADVQAEPVLPPLQAGIRAIEQRKWDDAERFLQQVPSSPATRDEVERNLQRARDGRLHEMHVAGARQKLTSGDARGALAQLGFVSASSPLAEEAEALRRQARELVVVSLLADANRLRQIGQIEQARQKLTEAQMQAPGDPNVERAIAALEPEPPQPLVDPVLPVVVAPPPPPSSSRTRDPVVHEIPSRSPSSSSASSTQRTTRASSTDLLVTDNGSPVSTSSRSTSSPTPAASSSVSPDAQRLILELYRSGDFAAASRKARELASSASGEARNGLLALSTQIDQFSRDYARVRAAEGNVASVTRQLQNCLTLDGRISNGTAYARQLSSMLVEANVNSARDAWAQEDWATACARAQQAASLDRSHSAARELVQRCERKASDFLSQGIALEQSDRTRATELLRTATQLAPTSSNTYRTASSHLRALGAR